MFKKKKKNSNGKDQWKNTCIQFISCQMRETKLSYMKNILIIMSVINMF